MLKYIISTTFLLKNGSCLYEFFFSLVYKTNCVRCDALQQGIIIIAKTRHNFAIFKHVTRYKCAKNEFLDFLFTTLINELIKCDNVGRSDESFVVSLLSDQLAQPEGTVHAS